MGRIPERSYLVSEDIHYHTRLQARQVTAALERHIGDFDRSLHRETTLPEFEDPELHLLHTAMSIANRLTLNGTNPGPLFVCPSAHIGTRSLAWLDAVRRLNIHFPFKIK